MIRLLGCLTLSLAIVPLLLLAACKTASETATCEPEDFQTTVKGGQVCFAIEVSKTPGDVHKTLLAFIHGDKTPDRDKIDQSEGFRFAHYPINATRKTQERQFGSLITVLIWRPGIDTNLNRQSSGYWSYNYAANRALWIADALAQAILRLKEYYKVERVVIAGQSGGAKLAAGIIGRHPDLAQIALLFGCPCDKRSSKRLGDEEFDPMEYVGQVSNLVEVVAVTGSKDEITPPMTVRGYIRRLQAHGVKAAYVERPGMGHGPSPPDIQWGYVFTGLGRRQLWPDLQVSAAGG